jgi:ribosome-binding protein aMBF1 (putative translation factor)
MNMEKKGYLKLLKDITQCSSLGELKDVVSKVNSFVKENNLKPSSDEFQKMEKFVKIVLLKLKSKEKHQVESKTNRTIIITEEQYNRLFT